MTFAGQRVGNRLKMHTWPLKSFLNDKLWILSCQYLTFIDDFSSLPISYCYHYYVRLQIEPEIKDTNRKSGSHSSVNTLIV